MKYLISTLLILIITIPCFADRVCLRNSDGKLIEYQSGDAPLGTLIKNAVNAGYNATNITEKYVTPAEWAQIKETQIYAPAREELLRQEAYKAVQQTAAQLRIREIAQKLNLTQDDLDAIKIGLGN